MHSHKRSQRIAFKPFIPATFNQLKAFLYVIFSLYILTFGAKNLSKRDSCSSLVARFGVSLCYGNCLNKIIYGSIPLPGQRENISEIVICLSKIIFMPTLLKIINAALHIPYCFLIFARIATK